MKQCAPSHTAQRGRSWLPPQPALFLDSLPMSPPARRHSPVVRSPRTSSSNQKLGARGQGRVFSPSLVLSSRLGTEEASTGE